MIVKSINVFKIFFEIMADSFSKCAFTPSRDSTFYYCVVLYHCLLVSEGERDRTGGRAGGRAVSRVSVRRACGRARKADSLAGGIAFLLRFL